MRTVMASLVAALVLLAASFTAQANLVQASLGDSGWQVTGAANGSVGVTVDREGTDSDGRRFVAIEIFKVFREGPDPQTQAVPATLLNFIQTGSNTAAAQRIYISDESITNMTGVTWRDFHWILGVTDVARFNRDMTNPTTNADELGWQIGPFTKASWSANANLGTEELAVAGGEVADGSSFFPGIGKGNLVIDIVGLDRGLVFTLKEIPTISEPASLMLIGIGATLVLLKCRSSRS